MLINETEFETKERCTFDAVSLGEVMLRFDPSEGRIRTARSFRVWEGGSEYHKCELKKKHLKYRFSKVLKIK